MEDQDKELEKISNRLSSIELRLRKLESAIFLSGRESLLNIEEAGQKAVVPSEKDLSDDEDKGLESTIGRFGLAWMGNIVLIFGITFFTQYLIMLGRDLLSALIGYVTAGAIYYLAFYLKNSNFHLASIFKINSQVLLFYVTVRLYFFTSTPLISSKIVTIILLIIVVAWQSYLAIRHQSQTFASLSVIFALAVAILCDSTHFSLLSVTMAAFGAVYYTCRYKWKPLLFITIILSYLSFSLWLFGNPFMGHPMQLLAENHSGVIYLFALGACFSVMLMLRVKDSSADEFLIGVTLVNGFLFTSFLLLVVIRFYTNNYVNLFSVITIFCLAYSVLLHSKSDWNFASAFYALYGFMAMSIALYGLFGLPRVYLLLSVQSLIVVSLALWFRNRLIVIMNSLLFLIILLVYLISSVSTDGVNFSFALIALISARIINWRKSRLQIKTELIRNLYLIEGFFMILYALVHAVPKQFVTLSWTMAALIYFIVSLVLKNVKYRYMALGTMICAAVYLFIIDLARIDLIYRVLALLFLAAISIGISVYYTNRIKRSDS